MPFPKGKVDIFIIPDHSAGSGFLYLPSLKPQWNSFIAGVACTLATVVIGQTLAPAIRAWWANFQGLGNMGMVLLIIAVGLGSWSVGRSQGDTPQDGSGGRSRPGSNFGGDSGTYYSASSNGGPPPNHAPPPNNPPPPPPPQPETPKQERPNNSWQDQPHHEQPRPQPQQQPRPPPPSQEPEPPKPQPPPQQQKPQPSPQPKSQPRETPQPTPPRPNTAKADSKGAWEKAREETRRREEERKVREAELKRKEETARRLRELREREAREREQREKESRDKEARERQRKEQEQRERVRLEKEVRDKVEGELREKVERENREREAREREAREREAKERAAREALERELRERDAREARQRELERMREEERQRVEAERRERLLKEAREREAKEARERQERLARLERERAEREEQKRKKEEEEKEKNARKGTSYAYSSVGEKTSMWPNGKPPAPSQAASSPGTAKPASPSPTKPTSKSAAATEEEAYSFRPYDKPKKPTARKKSVSDFSESSWAPSASTARTTPPPSMRGPYTTEDPQKIIIKAVYVFLNQFSKTPASQLQSGVGSVTDGLILRITSAGLFVDDDVRGVAQREWDVKAWTIKSVEVWCPTHALNSAASNTPGAVPTNHPFFKHMPSSQRRAAERGATKTFLGEEAVAYLAELGRGCQDVCRLGLSASVSASAPSVSSSSNTDKTGEWSSKGLHVIRVNIRDQEGKRYLFVVGEEQAWKISRGLQTLRGGTQVRALGLAGLSSLEAKSILETLGWS